MPDCEPPESCAAAVSAVPREGQRQLLPTFWQASNGRFLRALLMKHATCSDGARRVACRPQERLVFGGGFFFTGSRFAFGSFFAVRVISVVFAFGVVVIGVVFCTGTLCGGGGFTGCRGSTCSALIAAANCGEHQQSGEHGECGKRFHGLSLFRREWVAVNSLVRSIPHHAKMIQSTRRVFRKSQNSSGMANRSGAVF